MVWFEMSRALGGRRLAWAVANSAGVNRPEVPLFEAPEDVHGRLIKGTEPPRHDEAEQPGDEQAAQPGDVAPPTLPDLIRPGSWQGLELSPTRDLWADTRTPTVGDAFVGSTRLARLESPAISEREQTTFAFAPGHRQRRVTCLTLTGRIAVE